MTIKTSLRTENFQNEESRIQSFVSQMLVSRLFTACYIGRFYVEHLKSYRDVLRIQVEERDVIIDLIKVRGRICNFYKGAIWPAITVPEQNSNKRPQGHCIWVKLNKNLPLEEIHWFSIENVTISEEGELSIKIKEIRKVETKIQHSTEFIPTITIEWSKLKQTSLKFLQERITWHNTKESIRFVFLVVMTIVTVTLNILEYLGNYSICFFREFNNFVRVATPTLLAIIDLVQKTIGGFYLLIAMMFGRGNNQIPRIPPQREPLRLQGPYQKRYNY